MKTKERGITLIALVVTIIVLLILAGVSIQMLAGQSGILKNAQQAREETVKGQIRDDVRREIMEKMTENLGDISSADLYKILNKYFDLEKSKVKAPSEYTGEETNPWEAKDFPENFPELHSREGNYSFNLGDLYSGTGNSNKWDETKVTPTKDEKGNIIPVPKDFHYVEGAKDTGVVIADNNGNEFAWVPVPKAIADETVSGEATQVDLTKTDLTPMAELDGEDYRGVLYETWNVSEKTVKYIKYDDLSYHEPAPVNASSSNLQIIKDILDDETNYESADTFKTIMQKDYNDMVDSVATYGGFYVARYEMSLTDWQEGKKKAQYKKGEESATAESTSANTWYGLYAYNKQFAIANKYESVESSMIWGSQYDAMMNWMAKSGLNIASSSIEWENINTTRITGLGNDGEDNSTDILNNIYDLLGNSWEWTMEGNANMRTIRGGSYAYYNRPGGRNRRIFFALFFL